MPSVDTAGIATLSFYACANLLFVAVAALVAGIRALNGASPRPLTYRHLLAIGRILALAGLLLPLLAVCHGGSDLSPLRAQVWSAPSMHAGTAGISRGARIELGLDSEHATLPASAASGAALLLFATGLFFTLLSLVSEARATFRAIRDAHVLRRIGSVRILVSDRERVPFAAWIPGRFFIVLPAALLLRPADVRLALRHEGQHHRQRDSQYLYVALLARALFGINPAVHWLARQLLELQEFACDEALARRPGHCARTYCDCLLRVAEDALPTGQTPLRSFMASYSTLALARRIEAALQRPVRSLRAPTAAGISLVAVALLAALSAVIAAPVQDRRLSHADVERLVAATPNSSEWGLRANEAVLRQLNLLLGTPDGRAYLRSSIARMHNYEPSVLTELKRHGLPSELLAVPLVESGYRNLPARTGVGAGLWMFIVPTARHYGLEVSAERDERLDVQAESRAAMHMLADLQSRFRDWPLALMAYNSGVSRVEAGINATHSRDAWSLYQAGYGNEPDYLARTTAGMLILAHPELLD
jgi:membrane-bound lytic murein transglycosylase D